MTNDPRSPDPLPELARCRRAIEEIDRHVVALIAERTAIGREAATLKLDAGLPIVDPEREAAVIARAADVACALGLDEAAIREIFQRIVAITRQAQLDAE